MKKNKIRIVALTVAIFMVLAVLASCSSPSGTSSESPAESSSAAASEAAEVATEAASESAPADTEATEVPAGEELASQDGNEYHIAFAEKTFTYYILVGMFESAKKAVEDRGWKFSSSVSNFDAAVQANQIRTFINQGDVDAIICDPDDSEGVIEIFQEAMDEGINVVVMDTPTTGGDLDFTICFDNYEAGRLQGEYVANAVKEKNGAEEGVIVNAYGAMQSYAWRLRREGFAEAMSNYPGFTFEETPGEGDLQTTNDAVANMITKYDGQIDAVACPTDNPALGAIEALKANNMWHKVGEEGHVVFATIDAEPVAMDYIREGYYDATIAQDGISYGEIIVEMLDKYVLLGKEIPVGEMYVNDRYYWEECEFTEEVYGPGLVIPTYVIDSTNVDDPRHWGNIAWDEYGIRYEDVQ